MSLCAVSCGQAARTAPVVSGQAPSRSSSFGRRAGSGAAAAHSLRRCCLRPLLSARVPGAAGTEVQPSTSGEAASEEFIRGLIEFLKQDLTHLFDDQGIDASKYDERVVFEDPITRYDSLSGYLFNIRMLKNVFDPTFILHDVRQTGPWEVTTRWTMSMCLTFTKSGPLRQLWDPRLTFTGTSIMGVNPATGRFNRHADTWDAIQNQSYFSTEAFLHMLGQIFDLRKTPDLETPPYTVLRKTGKYEVRRYDPFMVAETPLEGAGGGSSSGPTAAACSGSSSGPSSSSMGPTSSSGPGSSSSSGAGSRGVEVNPASGSSGAFWALAQYIFGENEQGAKMDMTTPVFSDSRGRMQFVLGGGVGSGAGVAPTPKTARVITRRAEGGTYAVSTFNGLALEGDAKSQEQSLRRALAQDGLATQGADWLLARYNEPLTNPLLRRNEVLIPLADFQLW